MLIRYLKQLLQQWFALFFPALDLILLVGRSLRTRIILAPNSISFGSPTLVYSCEYSTLC